MGLHDTYSNLGTDIACFDDCFASFSTVSGIDNLLYALARRLITSNGSVFYDPDYGFNLTDYINATVDSDLLHEIRSGVIAECHKDERVSGVSCNVSYNVVEQSIRVECSISSIIGQPFKLILAIGEVNVSLLSIS